MMVAEAESVMDVLVQGWWSGSRVKHRLSSSAQKHSQKHFVVNKLKGDDKSADMLWSPVRDELRLTVGKGWSHLSWRLFLVLYQYWMKSWAWAKQSKNGMGRIILLIIYVKINNEFTWKHGEWGNCECMGKTGNLGRWQLFSQRPRIRILEE